MGQGETRRQNLYFPSDMLSELQKESTRQDRSISWLIQQAWKIARAELKRVPSTTDYLPSDNPDGAGEAER
ncbi:MAG: TIGR04563 family protein [Myxococcota bacterium]|nr:TIGR04563 family protein [Myxococcota bacterium]